MRLFFSRRGGKRDAFWAPSVSACRPLPPSSLKGRLDRRAKARQSFNAEVGHCVPPPCNDSPDDPRPPDRGHSSIQSPRTSISMFDKSGISGYFLSFPWLANGSSIDGILFEIGADYLYCANVLFLSHSWKNSLQNGMCEIVTLSFKLPLFFLIC